MKALVEIDIEADGLYCKTMCRALYGDNCDFHGHCTYNDHRHERPKACMEAVELYYKIYPPKGKEKK